MCICLASDQYVHSLFTLCVFKFFLGIEWSVAQGTAKWSPLCVSKCWVRWDFFFKDIFDMGFLYAWFQLVAKYF